MVQALTVSIRVVSSEIFGGRNLPFPITLAIGFYAEELCKNGLTDRDAV